MADMQESTKATSLVEIMRVCKPMPLSGPQLETFFVETDEARDPHQKTRNRILTVLESREDVRMLFCGHRGCGKSTELNKFLLEYKDRFLPVQFSIESEMTATNARAEDLVLVITERILAVAKETGAAVNEGILEKVYDYFDEKMKLARRSTGATLEAAAGVDISTSVIGRLLGLFAKFKGEIQLDSYSEETTVAYLRKRPAELLDQANLVIEAVRESIPGGRRLLVVVEDMDKLDLRIAREIYVNNVNLLTGIRANIIYTIPIFLFYSPDVGAFRPRFDDVVGLPMIKVMDPPSKRMPGFDVVAKIVLARVERGLIKSDALDLLIERTGGVLRHVFEVLYVVSTMANITAPIQVDHIRYGLDKLRTELWQQVSIPREEIPDGPKSVTELYDRLTHYAREQYEGGRPLPIADSTNQILLRSCALVQYNGKDWLGVHPLVAEYLKELGRL